MATCPTAQPRFAQERQTLADDTGPPLSNWHLPQLLAVPEKNAQPPHDLAGSVDAGVKPSVFRMDL